MPQTFDVVRCCNCATYQVDIHKMSTNKWTCKVCSTKQSLKQVFFQGDAKECRVRVQALNERCHQIKNAQDEAKLDYLEMQEQLAEEQQQYQQQQGYMNQHYQPGQDSQHQGGGYQAPESLGHGAYSYAGPETGAQKPSRWARFLDENDEPF